MRSKFLTLKNQTIHYLIDGKGKCLIILPSLWLTSKTFEETGNKLSQFFTVIIPDIYKGKSRSEQPSKNINDYISTLKDFIDKLKIKNYYLVGLSFSGLIATIFTNTYPSEIKKLLLISTSATSVPIKNKGSTLILGYVKMMWNTLWSENGSVVLIRMLSDTLIYFFQQPKQFILEALIVIKNYKRPTINMKVPSKLIFTNRDEFLPQSAIGINSRIKNLEVEVINKTHCWGLIENNAMVAKIKEYCK